MKLCKNTVNFLSFMLAMCWHWQTHMLGLGILKSTYKHCIIVQKVFSCALFFLFGEVYEKSNAFPFCTVASISKKRMLSLNATHKIYKHNCKEVKNNEHTTLYCIPSLYHCIRRIRF